MGKSKKKKVLITGAASGIGKAIAFRFASEDNDVCLIDIQKEKLQLVFQSLPEGNHIIIPGNYTDKKVIGFAENQIKENWDHLDVLVNCAGISEDTDLLKMEIDRWKQVFDIMTDGCLRVTQLAAKLMNAGGRIIHLTSIHGMRSERWQGSYAMAKAAINQFCRSMALDLADKNILVNAIAPGFVNAPMAYKNGENELGSDWFKENYIMGNHLPLRRVAEPEEIAGVALFLAGKDASYITGQVIVVDGGLTITF